jgi:phospholipid/cholesterol/gamma-HCH transport system substrate-binding protein
MNPRATEGRLHPAWWTAILIALVVGLLTLSYALFNRSFTSHVPVSLTSDRSGLVMEPGAKVKLRGIDVGQVGSVSGGKEPVSLKLEIDASQTKYIPANVEAEIKATTAFGNKFVDLIYPDQPSPKRLSAGQVLHSRNVSTEVNTVFENVVNLLHQIDPSKLNAVLTTLADGLRGQGETIGESITAANRVLKEINPRSETIRGDWQSLAAFSDTFSTAAPDILATLDAASTTSTTITKNAKDLDALLLNAIGLSNSGIDLIGPVKDNLIGAVNILAPTTSLLMKYNPTYTCLLMGSKWFLDHGGYYTTGGHNGYSLITDSTPLLGKDPYIYPDNLPIVAAKGGPGGKPGCGSLPDVTKAFPARQLVTNTGWGTGMDIRDNPGLGHPCWENFFPVTRAVPEPPSVRCQGPPSPGLVLPPAPPPAAPAPSGPPSP